MAHAAIVQQQTSASADNVIFLMPNPVQPLEPPLLGMGVVTDKVANCCDNPHTVSDFFEECCGTLLEPRQMP